MNAQEFCYWLQGFFELSEGKKLTPKQVQIIKDHLALVFTKITPDRVMDEAPVEILRKLLNDLPLIDPGIYPQSPINPLPPVSIPDIKPLYPPYTIECVSAKNEIMSSDLDTEVYC